MANRKQILKVLDKLGLNHTDKISADRGLAKIQKHLAKPGVLEQLDDGIVEALADLGFEVEPSGDITPPPVEPEAPAEPKRKRKGKKAEAPAEPKAKKVKDTKTKKPAPKAKATKRVVGRQPDSKATFFKELFAKNKTMTRKEVIEAMTKKFGDEALPTARNYIWFAKKGMDTVDVKLKEEKKGNEKFLTVI